MVQYSHPHLSIPHERRVLPHQDVGTKEEGKCMAEAQQCPVQKGLEGEERVLADVSVGVEGQKRMVLYVIKCLLCFQVNASNGGTASFCMGEKNVK
jgi:hypothetical protein